jgi:hypothetical protein
LIGLASPKFHGPTARLTGSSVVILADALFSYEHQRSSFFSDIETPFRRSEKGDHPMSTDGFRIPAVALACALLDGLTAQVAFAAVGDRVPYQELKSATCAAADQCSVDFKPVGVNRRLEVTSVSCLLFAEAAGFKYVKFVVLDAAGAVVMTDFGALGDRSDPYASLNNQTFFFAKPGEKIRAITIANVVSNLKLDCKIAGVKVTLQ